MIPRNQLGKCTSWEMADFIPGVIARRLEFARAVKAFSPTVVTSDIGVLQAADELGKLMASEGLATTWNDHTRLMVLHCHKVAPGVFGSDELAEINSWYQRNQDGISRCAKPHLRCQWGTSPRFMSIPVSKRGYEVGRPPPEYIIGDSYCGPQEIQFNQKTGGEGVVILPMFMTDSLGYNYPAKHPTSGKWLWKYCDELPKAMARFWRRSYDCQLDVVGGRCLRNMTPSLYEAKCRKRGWRLLRTLRKGRN